MQSYQLEDNKLIKIENKLIDLFNDNVIFSILSSDELDLIEGVESIPKYALKECHFNSHHLKVDHHQEYIYGTLNEIELNKNKVESIGFSFFLSKKSLIIVNKSENKFINKFVDNVTSEEFSQVYENINSQILLFHLMNDIIENNEMCIDRIEDSLEKLEEKIINNPKKEYCKEIIAKRKLIMQLRHKIDSFPYLTKVLAENESNVFTEAQLKTINRLDYKATKMVDNATLLRDYVSQIREAFEAERDMQTNELMKVFTVITSIFLPLTLIAGWYGMNFTTMPELTSKYGYVYVITLSISVVISLIIFFKKKKLLK